MPRIRLMLAVLVSTTFAAEAAPDDALAACRAIKDSTARLACYDALPIALAPRATPGSPPVAAPPAATVPEAARFGLPARSAAEPIQAIESHIPGHFSGWEAGSRIRLANGQVWQVTDGTSRFADVDNAKVTVRRGALGSFFLDIDGVNPAPRVRRIE
jgi:hypothetical protein